MGKAKVYGKRTGAISIASYSKFAADSSGNETSPDVSVLCEISSNTRRAPRITTSTPGKAAAKSAEFTNDNLSLKSSSSPLSLEVRRYEEPDSQSGRSQKHDSLREDTSNQLVQREAAARKLATSKKTLPAIDFISKCPRRSSPRKAKSTPVDGLSVLFDSIRLNDQPECSILELHSPTQTPADICDNISSKTRSYLSPILSCKNVSQQVSDFSTWMTARAQLTLEKVGEGSFGEVFRASSSDGEAVILKLMPLNLEAGKGSKSFTSISSAANEIRLLERMQRVPGFVEFRGACVLVGSLPTRFVELWKEYKSAGRTVESRDPSKKASYSTDQLWLLLEMSDAGQNLEPGQYAPPGETATKRGRYLGLGRTWDIFWEVVKSIAKAEYWAHFEHRDLHLGNVCARDTLDIPDKEDLTFVSVERASRPIPVNQSRLEITIIDYSLSRAFMDNQDDVLFYDFKKDKHLLKGQGDLQYDMYRHMAAAVGDRSPREYVPQTNVVWLWYLLNRLLAMTKELSARAKAKKRGYITREAWILEILQQVQTLTDPEYIQHWEVDSAAALLSMGIGQGWLSPDDVFE